LSVRAMSRPFCVWDLLSLINYITQSEGGARS
jgi:hypothetical protein